MGAPLQRASFIHHTEVACAVHLRNYFNDTYQGVPIGGYNRLIDGLLKGVDTLTGVDFFGGMDKTWHTNLSLLVRLTTSTIKS